MNKYTVINQHGATIANIECEELDVQTEGIYFITNKLVIAFVPNTFIVGKE